MKRNALGVLALLALLSGAAWAHLCNNIYKTPDRIIVKPEKDELLLETEDEVRIFVRNNYPTRLYNFKLTADTGDPNVTATVEPESMAEMIPGQKEAFKVSVHARDGAAQGKYALTLSIQADSFGFAPVHESDDQELIRYFGEGNTSSHVLVAESLARRENPEGVRTLTDLIQGNDRAYGIRAIRCAGRSGNKDLVPVLVPLLQQRDGAVKGNALLALGMLKAETDRIQPFLQDRDPFVCACAATALLMADAAPEGVAEELAAERFLRNESPQVRVAAAWGVVWSGNTNPLPILEEAIKDGDAELVVFAGDALLCLADQQEKRDADQAPDVAPDDADQAALPAGQDSEALAALPADRLYFNVVGPLPAADTGGDLSVQLYHSYPAPLHEVVVSAEGQGVRGKSVALASLAPTEISKVAVPLAVDPSATGELRVTITCKELREPAIVTASIPSTGDDRERMERARALPVGSLPVTVMKLGDIYAFAWGIPLLVALGATLWLSVRRSRRREEVGA